MDDDLNEEIESKLSYGDSKSEWIREAIRFRQLVDPHLDQLFHESQIDERMEFIEGAVRRAVQDSSQPKIEIGSSE